MPLSSYRGLEGEEVVGIRQRQRDGKRFVVRLLSGRNLRTSTSGSFKSSWSWVMHFRLDASKSRATPAAVGLLANQTRLITRVAGVARVWPTLRLACHWTAAGRASASTAWRNTEEAANDGAARCCAVWSPANRVQASELKDGALGFPRSIASFQIDQFSARAGALA